LLEREVVGVLTGKRIKKKLGNVFLLFCFILMSFFLKAFLFNVDLSLYGERKNDDEKAMWYSFASLSNCDDNSHNRTE